MVTFGNISQKTGRADSRCIKKRKSDGAFIISDIIDNQLITKIYLGYTEKESKSLFKRDKIKGWL